MDDTLEVVRQQMEATKAQLWEKLDTLEHQVSEAVQSTSAVVSETVASVQQTVSNATESVQDGVQSVSDAFDFRLQVERHPWFVVGGSCALGYLAYELLSKPAKQANPDPTADALPPPAAIQAQYGSGLQAVEPGKEALSKSAFAGEITGMLAGALMGAMSTVVSRVVPAALDYLVQRLGGDSRQDSNDGGATRSSPT